MQSRIDRLEGLVLALMTGGTQPTGPAVATAVLAGDSSTSPDYSNDTPDEDSMAREEVDEDENDLDGVTNSFGIMKVDANKSMYVGESHWAAILSHLAKIAEVKNFHNENKKQIEEHSQKVAEKGRDDETRNPGFLFNTTPPVERDELFAALPQRTVVDKLVTRYFHSCDPALHILHGPSFQDEYQAHWVNPSNTPVLWLGQLFSIMSIAMQSYHRAGDEPLEFKGKTLQMSNMYRNRTAECLVHVDFCKLASPVIETLILHLHGEYLRNAEINSWVMGGMIVRLAMRMGYHRDVRVSLNSPSLFERTNTLSQYTQPKHYPNITPFQGEIRRRVWAFVRMADTLLSFHIGLPSMVRSADCDTALPRNLYDGEFGKGITALPPSRPVTEATPISYMNTKAQLAIIFGDIVEQTNSVNSISYEDVMKLDSKLRDARASTPLHLRMHSLEESRMDPAMLIMQRYNLQILFHKSLCVLHRKFLARARTNPRYTHSRSACVDSSLELMRLQGILHQETLPQGRLRPVRWFVPSPTSHDFLLAAMIVCLDLDQGAEAQTTGLGSKDVSNGELERRTEMLQALEKSNAIWQELQDQSMEAYKANKTLTVMLRKLKNVFVNGNAKAPDRASPFSFASLGGIGGNERTPNFASEDIKPEHSAAMTLGMLSSGGVTSNAAAAAALFDRGYQSTPSRNLVLGNSPGFTPNYITDPTNSVSGDINASLFAGLGQQGNNLMDMPATFDWVSYFFLLIAIINQTQLTTSFTSIKDAWDSYIQNTSNLDPGSQLWPLGMDLPINTPGGVSLDLEGQGGRQQQQQQQQQQPRRQESTRYSNDASSLFMGLNTPSNNGGL
ncbi:MAG: hypothetical protein M1816_005379 [Peltula sp. TS41687]|nr:MAG: hypothetical protein M1816_005379 [Peltula sp. TS41687]